MKTLRTFSLDSKVVETYTNLSKEFHINMSGVVNDMLKRWLKKLKDGNMKQSDIFESIKKIGV